MLTSMHPSIFTKLICASQLEQNEAWLWHGSKLAIDKAILS